MKDLKSNKLFILLVFIFYSSYIKSQCAMCKAVVESNLESGDDIGSGLNDGILYLMSAPYLVFLLFGIFYFLQKRKQKQSPVS